MPWILLALPSLLVSPALACKIVTGAEHTITENLDDTVAPGAPSDLAVEISRGVGPTRQGASIGSTSCDDLGRIVVSFGASTDDLSAEENIGYQLRAVEGTLPDGLDIDTIPRADGVADDGTATVTLGWIDEATDDQEAFSFVLGLTPVDEAGNAGAEATVEVSDPGGSKVGCATVRGGGAFALALALLAASSRRRA